MASDSSGPVRGGVFVHVLRLVTDETPFVWIPTVCGCFFRTLNGPEIVTSTLG